VKFQNFASITLPPQLQSELNPDSACTLTPQPGWCNTPNGAGFLALGGLPATYIPPATQADARALTTSYIDDTVMPKILTWSLGLQREVYRNTTVEVRYLGTRGLSLPVQFRRNRQSYFDAGGTPLPTYFDPTSIPTSWNASTPNDTAFNNFDSNTYAKYGFLGNVTGDPPYGSSTYHAGSVNFTQRGMHGLTLNANYTYSHTLDDATNEFFTSLLNPRRAQDTNHIGQDWGNSDLDVRHKFALSLTYDFPHIRSDNKFVNAAVNGFQVSSIFLAQTGQPVTLQSGLDSNGNGDTAGDRVVINPFGSGLTGSDVYAICALPGGMTGLSNGGPGAFGTPTGLQSGGACFNPADPTGNSFFPAIGYAPMDPHAKYVVAGPAVKTSVARNSFFSPGFSTWNLGVAKRIYFSESKYLQARVDAFNVINHPSYALSNGNVFNAAGITTATTTQGYILPFDPNFLHASSFFSGGGRSLTLGLRFVF